MRDSTPPDTFDAGQPVCRVVFTLLGSALPYRTLRHRLAAAG
ncbi:MAG: hypothetical protein R2729_00700 [Bryobacteraceae bacterium]